MTSHPKMSFQTKAALQPLSSEMIDTADRSGSRFASFSHFVACQRLLFAQIRAIRVTPSRLPRSHLSHGRTSLFAFRFTRRSHIPSHVSKWATVVINPTQSTTCKMVMQNTPSQNSHVSHVSIPSVTSQAL